MKRYLDKQRSVAQDVKNGVRSAFRGVLNLVKSKPKIQLVQVSGLADETLQDVEMMQHFGFTSRPPKDTECIVIPLGGNTSHSIVIATENGEFRVKNLKGGEVAVYDKSGSSIILKQGRLIDVDCDTFRLNCKKYEVTATEGATINANTTNNGNLDISGVSTAKDHVSNGVSGEKHNHKSPETGALTSEPVR